MQLREGSIHKNASTYCAGCGEIIDCGGQYITLQLDNLDGSLTAQDYAFSYFHTEHCVSECIKYSRGFADCLRLSQP